MRKRLARLAVLIIIALIPMSAVAHTKLFYRMSYRSDYRKVEVMVDTPEPTAEPTEMPTDEPTVEPTATPFVEILLESTLTPEPPLTPIPTDVLTPTPSVEITDIEDTEEPSDQITTTTDISTDPAELP